MPLCINTLFGYLKNVLIYFGLPRGTEQELKVYTPYLAHYHQTVSYMHLLSDRLN